MRALTHESGDDRGAVLVWVALMLVVLFGVGALVLDAGALYAERRQLQNGADAAALAVAADCAEGDCLNESATADSYADSNANDSAANVDVVCGSGPGLVACPAPPPGTAGATGWVKVTTSTHNPANATNTQVKFVLAPVLDAANVGRTVRASAVAAWGAVGRATTIPVAFSVCEFVALGGSLDGRTFPSTPGHIYTHDTNPATHHQCPGSPSGQNLPGGFSWLDSTGCEVSVAVGSWVGSDTGNSVPQACDPAHWQDAEMLIPLYNETRGSGNNGEYHIVGFAGFQVLAYYLGGQNKWPSNAQCPSGGSGRCLFGKFTHVTTTADGFGGGTDFGARAISMVG